MNPISPTDAGVVGYIRYTPYSITEEVYRCKETKRHYIRRSSIDGCDLWKQISRVHNKVYIDEEVFDFYEITEDK